jgi:hypothetical protein
LILQQRRFENPECCKFSSLMNVKLFSLSHEYVWQCVEN